MVDPQTANLQLAQPTRGSDVGTWDVPVNGNMTILDAAGGGILTIGLNNTNVVLSSAQYTYKQIIFNSTLTGSVNITFPSTFIKTYEIYNTCTGSSAFYVSLVSAGGGNSVCCPPGETVTVVNDGTNMRFMNLDRIGAYWDYIGSSNPIWNSCCTVPPYLICNGGTFSATTYPTLATILGSTTLPDARGKTRFALDQGAGLISTAVFTSTSVGATGGAQTTTLGTSNLPPYTPAGTVAITNSGAEIGTSIITGQLNVGGVSFPAFAATPTSSFTGTPQGGVSAPLTNLPPAYIGGMVFIRAG